MNERGSDRTVLFHRIFDRFAGHHLKVWHYFKYVMDEPGYAPLMMMSDDSVWDDSNPWTAVPELVIRGGRPHPADMYFFSGPVWQPVHRDQRAHAPVPVIHYMQSLRHALPDNIRYDLLENKAIRICVSEYVADSLRDTGVVRGPVFTIPAAIDVADLRRRFPPGERDTDLLIVATKQPEMGRRAAERLRAPGRSLQLIDELVAHDEFLAAMRRARVTVFFPSRDEGAPLPMLEAMALGTFVVCPDAIGNRAYVVDGHNAFRPDYDEEQILEAAAAALDGYDELGPLLANASETVRDYDLPAERRAFIEILHDAERLWQQ
jgi:Glycosyl transferases group 1